MSEIISDSSLVKIEAALSLCHIMFTPELKIEFSDLETMHPLFTGSSDSLDFKYLSHLKPYNISFSIVSV